MTATEFFLYPTALLYAAAFLTALVYNIGKSPKLGAASKIILCLGFLLHTGGLAARIWASGHAPMASMYETLMFYSWTTVFVSLIVVFRYDERAAELFTVPVALIALIFGLANAAPAKPLTLVLRTFWFETHVTSSFAAYALFTLAFSGAVIYLIRDVWMKDAEGAKRYQEIASRSVLWGFCLFSASMFSGAVWAYLAWGNYWLWEPKVIWSFIVWFYYAGAMHASYVRAWRGRGLAVATVIGLFVVLFTYLGVSILMKSSHSF